MTPIRLMTLAPGHFHAALVQKHTLPGVHRRCHVYAPLDADLVAHLDRLAAFNTRAERPTAWDVDVRTGEDYLDRFQREQPGNTVVLSGRLPGESVTTTCIGIDSDTWLMRGIATAAIGFVRFLARAMKPRSAFIISSSILRKNGKGCGGKPCRLRVRT